MWHMYPLDKAQERKEALKDLPIVQVQPRQTTKPVELHLPPGEWTRQWRETHPELIHKPLTIVLPVITEDAYDDSWLNSKTPLKISLDGQAHHVSPAIFTLFYEGRQ